MNRIGIAADHAGFVLKEYLLMELIRLKYEIIDFGNLKMQPGDDFPDYIIPLAKALSDNKIIRGIAVCGSGVGACIIANKIPGVRAALIHEKFSAKQGVEDDDMNMICFGGRVIGRSLALELAVIFLNSKFSNEERHIRRLSKIKDLENNIKIKL